MTPDQLAKVLQDHKTWLQDNTKGKRANLYNADLRNASLRCAYLRNADLRYINLTGANLHNANLTNTNLYNTDLRNASLHNASLRYADLRYADLRNADLTNADLTGANLRNADLPNFQIPEGDLIVWKKCGRHLVQLLVPSEARRTASLIGRKCRAEFVKVLSVIYRGASTEAFGRNGSVEYRIGEIVYPDSYDDDIRVECTHGIHFFLTRQEAEEW